MTSLADFPVTRRWPAAHPDRIQLYTLGTPNGYKVSVALEELGLPYEAHKVSFSTNDQMTPEFLSLNPNNKIPAIIDPAGPGGQPMALWESGAILLYLADRTGRLIPADPARRWETVQWLMFQMGGVGPMFGQFGHFFRYAADKVSDPYARNRYTGESRRLLGVLEGRLAGRDWIMGDEYTIADIALWPWVWTLTRFYEGGEALGLAEFAAVTGWRDRCLARPASQRGLAVPG